MNMNRLYKRRRPRSPMSSFFSSFLPCCIPSFTYSHSLALTYILPHSLTHTHAHTHARTHARTRIICTPGCAEALGEDVNLSEGVYLASSGPSFETPAEINAFRILGADVVGMSMVPDVLCARHCGLRVVATTIVVNLAAGMTGETLKHEETLHFTKLAAGNMKRLLAGFLEAHEQW